MRASLVRHDRVTTRLAELDTIGTVLGRAGDTLREGWTQHEWAVDGGVCLVTAVRASATGQVRARAIDVVWHARYGDGPGGPAGVDRVPTPAVRQARVRDLTRWNDQTGRRVDEVLRLLEAAEALAAAEMVRQRARLGPLAGSPPAVVTPPRPRASLGV